jgi:hypothetical protein
MLGKRADVLLKQKISRVDNKNLFAALPDLFNPSSPPGQTAKTILLVSGGTGIDLSVDVVAVGDAHRPWKALCCGKRSGHEGRYHRQEKRGQTCPPYPMFFHSIFIPYSFFENKRRGSVINEPRAIINDH